MHRYGLFPINLQLFAEDPGAGGNPPGDPAPQSFDDFLKVGSNQTEYDRRIQDAVSKALETERQKWQALTDDKISEADKLAKMTKEEKAQYLHQKKEKELSDREAAIARKELMAEAKNTLAGKNLPAELAEVLNYTDADSCNNSIVAVEKAFQKAVQNGVEERLKGKEPMKKAPEGTDDLKSQIETIMLAR